MLEKRGATQDQLAKKKPSTFTRANELPHSENFPNIIPAQKELDGCKVAKQIFDMPVVEHTLQAEARTDRAMNRPRGPSPNFFLRNDRLHVQHIGPHDVIPVAGSVWPRVSRVEKRQEHSAWLQHRPQLSNHWLHQTLVQVVGQVPAQHDIKLRRGIHQVVFQKLAAIEHYIALLVFRYQRRISRGR